MRGSLGTAAADATHRLKSLRARDPQSRLELPFLDRLRAVEHLVQRADDRSHVIAVQDLLVSGQPLLLGPGPPLGRPSVPACRQTARAGAGALRRKAQPPRPRAGRVRQRTEAPVAVVLDAPAHHVRNLAAAVAHDADPGDPPRSPLPPCP